MTRHINILPGFILSSAIALSAQILANILPIHFIGASVISLFIGMGLNMIKKPSPGLKPGLSFTSKRVLKFAIILLGASLNIGTIVQVGRLSMTVMLFTLLTCFGGGYFIGRALGLDWKLSSLISAGTGICGGSAIAAIAPVIGAKDRDIAMAISATFLFDMVMILLFPIMGQALELSDMAYGLWAGTAVNDTSSVVAAGYAYSEAAGDFATMVKLTRTLSIIPAVVAFSLINIRIERKTAAGESAVSGLSIKKSIPWFILAFLLVAAANSLGLIPKNISALLKPLSKFMMVAALGAIGLNTDIHQMRTSALRPMLHGFIISALVVIVAIAVAFSMGIA